MTPNPFTKWLEGGEPDKKPTNPTPAKPTEKKPASKSSRPEPAEGHDNKTDPDKKKRRRGKRGGRGRGKDGDHRQHPRNANRDPGAFVGGFGRRHVAEPPKLIEHKKHIESVEAKELDKEDGVMRVVPIGGCDEVGGRNVEAIFYNGEILIIDCGIMFSDNQTPGVDYILPNTQLLEERKDRIKGMLITHGHLDHIGALPYVLPKLGFPRLYGTKLTLGFAKAQLTEFKLENKVEYHEVNPDEQRSFQVGRNYHIDYFRVNHSIPDSCGIRVKCEGGTLVHTGDFKFDFTPADGIPCDMNKMTRIGQEGVDLLMSDSTGVMKPGFTTSESVIVRNLAREIEHAQGRVILATFSSLIGRVQHVLDAAVKSGRTVFVSGRSMLRNVEMAVNLGYLKVPRGQLRDLRRAGKEAKALPDEKIMILCTGSQGEELAALSRISRGEHQDIKVKKKDTIIFSATPIPGNEAAVANVMDDLTKKGANVVTQSELHVHTSGHGSQEDMKLMLRLMQPRYFAPVHGMHFMRVKHGQLGVQTGVAPENIVLLDNGTVVEIKNEKLNISEVQQETAPIYIDGLGVGDVTDVTIEERLRLSENGILIALFKVREDGTLADAPEVVSRGFMHLGANEQLLKHFTDVAGEAFDKSHGKETADRKLAIQNAIEMAVQMKLDREPIVLPLAVRV